jgi:hypothetical protein
MTQLANKAVHRRCRDCIALEHTALTCSGCGVRKQPDQFSKTQLAKDARFSRCRDCVSADGRPHTCSACGVLKRHDDFSGNQLRCSECRAAKRIVLTCRACGVQKQPAQFSKTRRANANADRLRCVDCSAAGQECVYTQLFCSACCEMRQGDQFSKTQLAKRPHKRCCMDCMAAGQDRPRSSWSSDSSTSGSSCSSEGAGPSERPKGQGRGAAAAAAAANKGPLVRVRDVQKHYGHLSEIPLEAYMDAGVAWSRNDLVSESDVEAASDAWDARGIAHDIDMQWGAMPWGGAYKDSNRYYGPGCYDYY